MQRDEALEKRLAEQIARWENTDVPSDRPIFTTVEIKYLLARSQYAANLEAFADLFWGYANIHRGKLIEKEIAKTLTNREKVELKGLQNAAVKYIDLMHPLPPLPVLKDHRQDQGSRKEREP